MPIRRLDPLVIDRIAAGEVIERPAAAVKELVENALDAGAKTIEVAIEAGGRRLIRVADDGRGMDAADLALSVERHATSKIPDGDLTAIATFGFRGEALPSIASVSRLEIRTRAAGAPTGLKLVVEDGREERDRTLRARPIGTRVEARDLFAATPARLKFLKSDRAEAQAVADVVRRLAMAAPAGALFVRDRHRRAVRLAGVRARAKRASPSGCARRSATTSPPNSLPLDASREGVRLTGRIGPADLQPAERARSSSCSSTAARCATRRSPGALRAAYLDFLPADRHAVAALFVECDPQRGRRQRPSRQGRGALPRRGPRARPRRRRDQAAPRRGAASRRDHRRDGDRPRHAAAAGLPRRLVRRAAGTGALRPRACGAALRRAGAGGASPTSPRRRAAPRPRQRTRATSPRRSARRGRRCTRPTSSPRPPTASSSSTSTRRTSASSTRS